MEREILYGIRKMIEGMIIKESVIPDIAIFPFGINGMLTKQVLNQQFGIMEKYIVDQVLSKYNETILNVEQLLQKDFGRLIVLLNTTNNESNRVIEQTLVESGRNIEVINIMAPDILRADNKADHFSEIKSLLKVKTVSAFAFVRIGRNNDGGYIMLDDFSEDMKAYSIGICDDMSWDKDIHEKYGMDVYMYDHTVPYAPEKIDGCYFYQKGIAAEDRGGSFLSLRSMLKQHGDERSDNLVLKMDVEGAEWDVLNAVNEEDINRFCQIVIEFHGMTELSNREKMICALKKINRTHQAVWGNNYAPAEWGGSVLMPMSLEVCYVRKKSYDLENRDAFFPTELDMPNFSIKRDYMLGNWGCDEK